MPITLALDSHSGHQFVLTTLQGPSLLVSGAGGGSHPPEAEAALHRQMPLHGPGALPPVLDLVSYFTDDCSQTSWVMLPRAVFQTRGYGVLFQASGQEVGNKNKFMDGTR